MGTSQQAWDTLAALPAWQLTEIARPDGDPGRDTSAGQRFQALTSAYGSDEPLAIAWLRDRPGGLVRVLAAGHALVSGQRDGEQAVLTLPSGARGTPLPDGQAAQMLAGLPYWTRITGVTDVLLAEDSLSDEQMPPSLEDGLLSAWLDAFGWLLLAEPVAERTVAEMAVETAWVQMHAENDRTPRAKLAARRAAARHAELRQATTAGLWRVHLLAGAATADDAARVARLVCASADLRRLPYALAARRTAASLPETLATPIFHKTTVPAVPVTPSPPGADGRSWRDTPIGEQAHHGAAPRWPDPRQALSPAEAAARAADERDTMVPESPFTGSTRLLAALAQVPAREVPGLLFTLRPSFDVTPEPEAITVGPAINVGIVLDRNRVPAAALTLPLTSLNRHVLVCGATGAGKSQTVRHLLEQAASIGIPWLVIEPAKAEYRLMATRLPEAEVIRIRPGDLDQAAAGINPLEPAPGLDGTRFPLQVHADLLRALFLAAFQADEPFPQILSAALTRTYQEHGWDLVTGGPAVSVQPAYPSLEDLQTAALAVVDEAGYGREIRDNVRGFVTVRIGSLRLGTTGRFLDAGHPLDFTKLLAKNVVLEIEDAGDDHDKAFLIGAVLIRLTEHLRLRARSEPAGPVLLRHLTVIEEAHRLLRQPPPGTPAGPATHAVEMFADLLAEIRAYGEGLIIAEQIPVKLIPDTVKNTAIKIAHRLPAADDRGVVGATMNLHDAQSEYLVTLRPGEAAVHADGMDYPLLARMPDGTTRESVAPAATAPPDSIVGRRNVTCGVGCRSQPCTLGEMRAAQRAAVTDPRITLWAELTVVAHLTGWPMPRPTPVFAADLQVMPVRLRDCALSHAVDAAVAARASAISTRIAPGALASHVADFMRGTLAARAPGCAGEEPEYLAPPYRWTPVKDALKAAARSSGGRHPRSDEWERIYGEPIPGNTVAEQARIVNRWSVRDHDDAQAVAAVIWGIRPRTRIEQAVGTRADDPAWTSRLTDHLGAFVKANWPRNLLRRPPEAGR